ncbi:MAG: NAD(P)-binding domain-containing protein [Polyangiaceae bacterium]|nr:NAD(P)-binding domain-containing protein [Polyangiaceae bacterium]
MTTAPKVSIIGGGTWGSALAAAAANGGSEVVMQSRRGSGDLRDFGERLPKGVRVVRTVAEAARHGRLIVITVPSAVCRNVVRDLGNHVDGSHYIVHCVRGLEGPSLETISDIVRHETPVKRTGALGGPALARDLMDGRPSVSITGSRFVEVNEAVSAAFGSPVLKMYHTLDLHGLEWASALVGCLTLAVGYAQALDVSAGLMASLIAQSIDEASRIAAAAGGEEQTLLGLAGYGDLLASIVQAERPEVRVGTALGKGMSREEAIKAAGLHVEALELIPRVAEWAEARAVHTPIFHALASGLTNSGQADAIVRELMSYG